MGGQGPSGAGLLRWRAALIAVLLGMLASLFVGGWVTAQLTAGESEREAILYGILTWAATVGISVLVFEVDPVDPTAEVDTE